MPPYQRTIGIVFSFAGDHHVHHVHVHDDVATTWDKDSLVLTLHLDQLDAEELYWQLLAIIPKLRADRR